MIRPWQILLHAHGFEINGSDDDSVIGFYTVRRVIASSQDSAESICLNDFRKENKVKLLSDCFQESGERSSSTFRIIACETIPISWYQWMFGKYAKGLIFYGALDDAADRH